MKLRQFLRNSIQFAIDKHRGNFFREASKENNEKDTPNTQSKNAKDHPFIKDFQTRANCSPKLNPKAEDDATKEFIIDESLPSQPSQSVLKNSTAHEFIPEHSPENSSADFSAIFSYKRLPTELNPNPERQSIGHQREGLHTFSPYKLKENRIFEEKFAKKKKKPGSLRIKIEKKAQVVRQLAILLKSGMDLRSSLAILEEQETHNRDIRFFLHDLFIKIESGDSFSEALTASIVKFDKVEIAMVRTGEAIGKQSDTLAKMAALLEKKIFIRKKVVSAMFYPVTVLVVALFVVLLLTTFVVPKFEKIIGEQVGTNAMPTLTKAILYSSRFITSHLLESLTGIGIISIVIIAGRRIATIKKIIYAILLKIPLIGECVTKWDVVLFARTFGDLLICGCSLIESLKMSQESIENYYMKANLALTIEDVKQGTSLADSIRRHRIFPAMAEGLIKVGEESGNLGEMMNKISSSYEEQLNEILTRITSLIEPILVIFLAIFVGSIVVGLFLPLVSLIQNFSD